MSAFTNVNVVPMDRERVLPDRTVLVRDGRIAEMGPASSVEIPEGAQRIDGRGRYLMPGLADMHMHLAYQDGLLLYLANGVTTVRSMSGRSTVPAWREAIARGELLGPTIYTTGPIVDGSPPVWPGSAVVETAQEADSVVRDQKEAGYDFIKVYGGLSSDAYLAVLEAAERHGIRAVGHVPSSVGIEIALSAGQASIEHLAGYFDAIRPDNPPVNLDWVGLSSEEVQARQAEIGAALLDGEFSLDDLIDQGELARLAEATRAAGVWNVPTLVVHQRTSLAGAAWEAALAEPEMAYVAPQVMSYWRSGDEARSAQPSAERARFLDAWRQREIRIVRSLREAGARILLGTDAPNPFVVPGFSIQTELRNLVKAGLTPYEAIRAGTRDAAEFLGGLDEFGIVSVGKRADLILLGANPLEDVSNVARRVGVMVGGRWLSEVELEQRLAKLATSYSTPSTGADLDYAPNVPSPAFEPNSGPRVCVDAGHGNLQTAAGRYYAFAQLLRADGFRVADTSEEFTEDALRECDVLAVANAGVRRPKEERERRPSAFKPQEIEAVVDWVVRGGSLLLLADHAPAGLYAADLASRFDIEMSLGYALDLKHHDPFHATWIEFSRDNGLIGDHPITAGRSERERVERIVAFTGQALRAPDDAVILLRLSASARSYMTGEEVETAITSSRVEDEPSPWNAQGAALRKGDGRVVILAEAALATSQIVRDDDGEPERFGGLTYPGVDSEKFVINILRWLAGVLEP